MTNNFNRQRPWRFVCLFVRLRLGQTWLRCRTTGWNLIVLRLSPILVRYYNLNFVVTPDAMFFAMYPQKPEWNLETNVRPYHDVIGGLTIIVIALNYTCNNRTMNKEDTQSSHHCQITSQDVAWPSYNIVRLSYDVFNQYYQPRTSENFEWFSGGHTRVKTLYDHLRCVIFEWSWTIGSASYEVVRRPTIL